MNSSLWMQLLKHPRMTGTAVPSSRFLAKAMAQAAQPASHVVELGAGTGAITAALWPRWKTAVLSSVELQPELAHKLQSRFPELKVHQGCAAHCLDTLQVPDHASVAIVSSLPFRSLPEVVSDNLQRAILAFLARHERAWLVQFTYQPRAPFEAPDDFEWKLRDKVWLNTPPAGVWVLSRKAT